MALWPHARVTEATHAAHTCSCNPHCGRLCHSLSLLQGGNFLDYESSGDDPRHGAQTLEANSLNVDQRSDRVTPSHEISCTWPTDLLFDPARVHLGLDLDLHKLVGPHIGLSRSLRHALKADERLTRGIQALKTESIGSSCNQGFLQQEWSSEEWSVTLNRGGGFSRTRSRKCENPRKRGD